ncbi:MAG: lytic transglycosylase domain-containing protein [Candidatus Eremiobacteraeota bacterium]|nr:lytic transglycosylase domain-containing protein [Candidatus Eremiobacteraeota bacterium]
MHVEPMVSHSHFVVANVDQPALRPDPSSTTAFRPADATQIPDQLVTLETRFSTLFKQLSKEFAALEKRLTQAIAQLAKSATSSEVQAAEPAPSRAPQRLRYGRIVSAAAQRNEVDPALLTSVIGQESGFDPRAVSKAGAMGLMQLMPDTARSLGVKDPFDPAQNVEGGARMLRQLLDRYHGRVDFALAAYNAGAGVVDRYGGIPPYAETQQYVRDILTAYHSDALSTTPA